MKKSGIQLANFLVLFLLLLFNLTFFWATAGLSEGGMLFRDWIYIVSPFIIWGILYLGQLTRQNKRQMWIVFAFMVIILFLWQAFAQTILRLLGLN